MIDTRALDQLARRIGGLMPPGMERLHAEVRDSVKALVAASLERMDVVTREEFEVQTAVLARTRAKLEALEATVARLETILQDRRDAAGIEP
jgi:BMFP domain-containing protein YqiC